MATENGNRKNWTILIFLFVGLEGLLMQIRGPLIPAFEDYFSISSALSGLIATAFSLFYIVSVLIFGMKTSKISIKKWLTVGIGIYLSFIALLGIAPAFSIILVSFAGAGFAAGIGEGLGRPALSHLYPEKRGWIFNNYDLVWAVGATLGPFYVASVLKLGSWRLVSVPLLVAFFLLFLILRKESDLDISHGEKHLDVKNLKNLISDPTAVCIILISFAGVGAEGGLYTWMVSYMKQFFSDSVSILSHSVLMGAYIPGRFTHSWLSKRIKPIRLVLLDSLIVIPLMLMNFIFVEGYPILIFVFLMGFFVSGIFPNLIAFGSNIFSEFSGPINALALGSSRIGIAGISALMGVVANIYSMTEAMYVLIFLMGLVSITSIIAGGLSKASPKKIEN